MSGQGPEREGSGRSNRAAPVAVDKTFPEPSGLGLFSLRSDGLVLFLDRTAFEALGLGRLCADVECVLGRRLPDPIGRAALEQLFDGPSGAASRQLRFPLDGPPPRMLAMQAYFVEDPASGMEVAHGIVEEIQEGRESAPGILSRTELEDLVSKRTAELETANRELEAFAASVSHDLRSPLTIIKGFTQALSSGYGQCLGERGNEILRRMQEAADRMESLIDDLLALSKVNQLSLAVTEVDISRMVIETGRSLAQLHDGREVRLEVQDSLRARGDERLVRLIVENLLSNAFKFTGKTERATIEFGMIPGSSRRPVFFVRDNGAGFPMKSACRLFAPFQRLHSKDEFPGTGIGMATVRRAIERHGGSIWVESAIGQGTSFYFTLAHTDEDR